MDLSSSATQRNTTSEVLSIQPGSVRVTTAVAANEFARHLAENARTDAGRRRDDRTPERTERTPERPREARDGKTESRKASEERDTAKDDSSVAQSVEGVAAVPLIEEATAAKRTEASPLSGTKIEEAAVGAKKPVTAVRTASETPEAAPITTPQPPAVETAAPKALEGEAAIAETGNGKDAAPKAHDAGKAKPEAPNPGATAAQPAASGNAPNEARPAGETAPGKPDGQIASSRPLEANTPDTGPDVPAPGAKQAEEAKPAKGLGQEAAEQLAGKKADARQTADLPKAALQAVQQMAQQILRAAAAQTQNAPLVSASIEANGTGRALDMPASGLPQGTQANGTAATVRIGTLPGQSQPTQVPAAAIALQMARNLQKGISRFEIRLDPPEMGRIDVRMEIRKDGQVVAHMSVERPETLDLLQRDARALQQALNNAGLQADGDSLNFSLKDGQDDASNRSLAEGRDASGGEDAGDDVQAMPVYNVNLAADGGVDIRV